MLSRLFILLCQYGLHSCNDESKIEINLKCEKKGSGIYSKCIATNLSISESDKNSSFLIKSPQNSTHELVIEQSSMLFIPPEIFEQLTEIRLFNAKNISIKHIYEQTFSKANKLHYLVLSNNRIARIVDKTFINLSDLLTLKLQHNELVNLSAHAFFGLTQLENLLLSFNQIAYLPLYIFRELSSLEILELDNNFIKVISFDQFETNLQLTTLDLGKNEIATIDIGTFANLTFMKRLMLNRNICVDKDFAAWRADNQSEINCCFVTFEKLEGCLNEKLLNGTLYNHVPLILILFFSIFTNFFIIAYYCIFKTRLNKTLPDDMEMITSDLNGSACEVYWIDD